MSRDEIIILDFDRETPVVVNPIQILNLDIDLWTEASIVVNLESDVTVIVDLESMGFEPGSITYRQFGKVARVILFVKAILARKTTFGRSNFVVTNNIQTIGTAYINPSNHNLIGIPITFTKAVSGGYVTTFGQTSFVITNHIQSQAINTGDPVDFYSEGLYGEGPYAGTIGQGSGASSFSSVIGFGATTSGYVPIKSTAVAEISLASHAIPAMRINHSIKIRARTVSGVNGVIKAALYEGAVNRSGDLISGPLSNTLTDHTLTIPDAAVATITDYSNLSIKIWGYDSSGNGLVFEISRVYLQLPVATGSISYGSVSRVTTFTKAVSGNINSKKTATAEISLASHGFPSIRTVHRIKVRARTVSGSNGVIKAALYEGAVNRSGDLISEPLTNVLADYTLVILDPVAATITDYSNLSIKFWGYDIGGTGLVFEISKIYLELPVSISKSTTTAEISLASHGTPSERTNHSIKVSARTPSGSTGVLKAELYEGTTLRSGLTPLITPLLTTYFTEYTLSIPDDAVVTITNYSNLSIKFWGFDLAGNALVFEVSNIYLELPVSSGSTTHYGSVSRVTTFTKAVSGNINSKRTTTAEISLASHVVPTIRTNHSIRVRARTTSGSTGVLKAELYEGTTLRSGTTPLVTSLLTTSLADYILAIPDAAAATITSYSNLSIKLWGFDSAGNALVFEVSRLYLELPTT